MYILISILVLLFQQLILYYDIMNTSSGPWNAVDNICPKQKSKTKIEALEIKRKTFTSTGEIADQFNKYYTTVGQKYAT